MIGKKIKVCKDRENVTLVLYRNICNIWCKNVIQISYKNHKFSVCFLLAAGHIQFIYNYTIVSLTSSFCCVKIIQKPIDTYYSSIFEYKLFILIIH